MGSGLRVQSLENSIATGAEGLGLEDELTQLNHCLSNFKSASKHVKLHLVPARAAGKAKAKNKAKAK